MKDESSSAELEYCYLCRFPLVLLKIRTPAEHIQKCKERSSPKLKCSEGIYCHSKMESHYQLFSHENPPHAAGSAFTKSENLNNNSNAFPSIIDLTDSQTSSEDFTPMVPSTLKNRSNFLNSSRLNRSKISISSKTHTRKRRISKNSSIKQENRQSQNDSKSESISFSLNSSQVRTPFTIAREQRRNLQQKKSKVINYDSIDLTQESKPSNDVDKVFSNQKSKIWKHSRIVNVCDSSSSETDFADKPFVTLSKSPKKSKRSLSTSNQKQCEVNNKRRKHDLSAVIESPSTSKQGYVMQTKSLESSQAKVENEASANQDNFSKIFDKPCESRSSRANESNNRSHFSTNDSAQCPVFQSTQISDPNPRSSLPTSLETLDSEDFSTPPPRGPGFVPMTPIDHDKTGSHGRQIDTDEEEDLFAMSPPDKSPEVQIVAVVSCAKQEDSLPINPAPTENVSGEQIKHGSKIKLDGDNATSESPMRMPSDENRDRNNDSPCKKVSQPTETRSQSNGTRNSLQIDSDEQDSFDLRPLEISLDENLDETVLDPEGENSLSTKQHATCPDISSDKANMKTQSSKVHEGCDDDAGLSFSGSDQDDYQFLEFASADTAPFTGPPDILKDQQLNSCPTDKEVSDNALADRMDNLECSSVILHNDSKTFRSSNNSSHNDVNNNMRRAADEPSSDIEAIVADYETLPKSQEIKLSKSCSMAKNQPAFNNADENSQIAQEKIISDIAHNKSKDSGQDGSGSTTRGKPSETGGSAMGEEVTDVSQTHFSGSLAKSLDVSVHISAQSKSEDLSPVPKNLLLPSPEDVRVVQKHPVPKSILFATCSRKLNFDGLKHQASHSNHEEPQASDSDGSREPPSKSGTDESAQNQSMLQAQWDKLISKSEMHSPTTTEAYETAAMSLSDQNDSDSDAIYDTASSLTKLDGDAGGLKLRVCSNIQKSQSLQCDRLSDISSSKSHPKDNKGKQRKQADIGAMFFGMKPKVQQQPVEHDNATMKLPYERFRQRYSNKSRSCPFYKKIAGTDIAVDAFSYGPVPGINVYFLSHFHFDHYVGLERGNWKDRIFCGQSMVVVDSQVMWTPWEEQAVVTGNLLAGVLRIPNYLIVRLPLCEEKAIGNASVTLLDANHCPGAVLFLFKLKNNTVVLHTGDFRATPEMEKYSFLNGISIHTLHLDTTYLDPEYCFPRQSVAIEAAVTIATQAVQECPKTLFVVGSYDIGKERIFCSIAKALNSKIYVISRKMSIMKCLGNDEITNLVTTKASNACKVHVIPMRSLNIKHLKSLLSKHHFFNQIVAIKPTGWAQGTKTKDLNHIKPTKSGNVQIYGLPYSEHSSFDELRRFVKFVKPRRVIPTVNVGRAESRDKMNYYLNAWKDGRDVENK